jgi:hypothetical protein
MDGWRVDVDYPQDRDEAERRLRRRDTGNPEPEATD